MVNCRQCRKELPKIWSTDICLECSRENVRKIFKENPEVEQAFHESVQEMLKPETINKMTEDACHFMSAVQALQKVRK